MILGLNRNSIHFISLPVLLVVVFGCQSNEKTKLPVAGNLASSHTPSQKLRFECQYTYKDFSVDKFDGKKSLIDYKSNKMGRNYKSAITWAYNEFGLQFGGHYGLARWSNGTNSIQGVIIDLIDGKIYDLPSGSLDYGYKEDSRLFIVNPPDSAGFYDTCFYCKPEAWIWNETKRRFEK